MATLSSKQRRALPKQEFALPSQNKFPIPDKSHAANAKARATQQGTKGNLSPAQVAAIKEKANKVLGNKTGATGFIMKKKLA